MILDPKPEAVAGFTVWRNVVKDDLDFALHLARGAGEILAEGFSRLETVGVAFKGRRNPVTEIDRASEDFLRKEIANHDRGSSVLGEEGGGDASRPGRLWIVDPLDGTVNFMHGHPVFAVSVALHAGGRIEAGVVHAPVLGETFCGARGEGAFRNGERLSVSGTTVLSHALLATGFAYDRSDQGDNNLENFTRLSLAVAGLRRMGAAALDLAWVASGVFDGFWELGLAPWDVAAGALLVSEAGGAVTAFDGTGDWLHGRNIVASNGRIHEDIRGCLNPFSP